MLCKRLKAPTVMNLNNEYLKFYSYKTEDLDIRKLGLTDHRAKRSEYAKYLQFIKILPSFKAYYL